jgi:hypothetical protein
MAIVRVTPTEIDVKTGLFDRRPRQIRIANENVPVIEIAQVRDELAAYPIELGPRRIFEVRTQARPALAARGPRSRLTRLSIGATMRQSGGGRPIRLPRKPEPHGVLGQPRIG